MLQWNIFNTLIGRIFNNTQIQESKPHRTFIEIFRANIKKGSKDCLLSICIERVGLHSHTFITSTHLFKKFIEKFIERIVTIESS